MSRGRVTPGEARFKAVYRPRVPPEGTPSDSSIVNCIMLTLMIMIMITIIIMLTIMIMDQAAFGPRVRMQMPTHPSATKHRPERPRASRSPTPHAHGRRLQT